MKKKWTGIFIIGLSLFCLIVCAKSIATEYSQGPVIQKEEAGEAVLLGEYWTEGSEPAESLNEILSPSRTKTLLTIFPQKNGSRFLIWTEH